MNFDPNFKDGEEIDFHRFLNGSRTTSDTVNIDEGSYRVRENQDSLILQADRVPTSKEMLDNWWESVYQKSQGKDVIKNAAFDVKTQLDMVEFDLNERISRLEKAIEQLRKTKLAKFADDYDDDIRSDFGELVKPYSNQMG